MRAMFGAAVTSIAVVQAAAEQRYGREQVAVAFFPTNTAPTEDDKKHIRRAKLVLIPGVMSIKRLWPLLDVSRAIGVVFDGPTNLQEVRALRYLDIDRRSRDDVLSYAFKLVPFDYAKLFDRIEADKPTRYQLTKHRIKMLPHILGSKANGGFIEIVNNLIYFNSEHDKRTRIKRAVLAYFHSKLTLVQLRKKLTALSEANEPRRRLIVKLTEYLAAAEGKKLLLACKAAFAFIIKEQPAGKPRAVPYKKIVKQFGLENRLDLKSIVAMHRELLAKPE